MRRWSLFGSLVITAVCFGQTFEVASVKVAAGEGLMSISPFGENRYSMSNASLSALVQLAYGVPYQQIDGIEKLGKAQYDIAVKAEDGVLLTIPALQPRLQRLLEERFKLRVHRTSKIFDGYALIAARGGLKLKPGSESAMGIVRSGRLRLMNATLEQLAETSRSIVGRPVMDKTGAAGNYDFDLTFAPSDQPDSTLPSFVTAMQEQYGLRLEKAQVPLEVVTIDSVETRPAEN